MNTAPQEDAFSKRLDLRLWAQVFRYALPYRNLLVPLVVAAVAIALCEASFALVTRWAVDAVKKQGAEVHIWPLVLVYGGLIASFVFGVWLFINKAGALSNHMSHDIRRDCFRHLQELEFSYFDHRPLGWLISRLTSDCDKLARIIAWGSMDLIWASCLVSVIAVVLVVLHPMLGLCTLSVVTPLILISAWFQQKLLLSSRETRKINSMITASFSEALQGMRTTKTLVREEKNLEEFQHLSEQMYGCSMKNALQSAVYFPIVLTIGSVATGIIIWYGGGAVLRESLSLGTFVAFIFYAGQFFNPIKQIAQELVQMQGAQAAGERVLGLLAMEPKIRDSEAVRARLREWDRVDRPTDLAPDGYPQQIWSIAFDGVDFGYEESELVLRDFHLEVRSGETIALVGASGGGKSTIVNLAARFYEPTGGRILVNGQDYRERSLAWYQSNLGIVLQGPHLFSGTIRENIRYGKLEANDKEVEEAARMVNADGFIRALEQGYETEVGEGGSRLSTGQKQLVSFARALLARPQIFIMDEATSSIDTETEQLIQKGLKMMFQGRISFVIAHRLSTIRTADRILVIEKGRILESGTHEELLAAGAHYHGLYTRQFRRQTEANLFA